MRVLKGSLLALKAITVNVLYLLQGATQDLKGKTWVSKYLDTTLLWYRRSKYVSAKDLCELGSNI